MTNTIRLKTLPKHVAIIMDGNRRWAKQQGLGVIRGHEYVVNAAIEPLVDRCIELGIPYLTLWAFSTENWDRDRRELEGIMRLFRGAFKKQAEDLHRKGVCLKILGEIDKFPKDIAESAKHWVEISKENKKITVSFALNYGGRDEILRAVQRIVRAQRSKGKILEEGDLTIEALSNSLDTKDYPDPDLIIRPGGQLRLSGFMAWQSVYSELYFTETLMPDFSVEEFNKALEEFSARQRRFGK